MFFGENNVSAPTLQWIAYIILVATIFTVSFGSWGSLS